jgi:hypothetical protein
MGLMLANRIIEVIIKQIGDIMNVKVFRLNSGEEVIARFEEKEKTTILKDPAVLVPMGQGQIGMMPWMMYTKAAKGIEIPNNYIAFTIEPLDELKGQYDSGLNKGIVTPSKSVEKPSGLKLTT